MIQHARLTRISRDSVTKIDFETTNKKKEKRSEQLAQVETLDNLGINKFEIFNKMWWKLIPNSGIIFYKTESSIAWRGGPTRKGPFIAVNNLFTNFCTRNSLSCPVNPIFQIDNFLMHEIDYRSSSNYLRSMARDWWSPVKVYQI